MACMIDSTRKVPFQFGTIDYTLDPMGRNAREEMVIYHKTDCKVLGHNKFFSADVIVELYDGKVESIPLVLIKDTTKVYDPYTYVENSRMPNWSKGYNNEEVSLPVKTDEEQPTTCSHPNKYVNHATKQPFWYCKDCGKDWDA